MNEKSIKAGLRAHAKAQNTMHKSLRKEIRKQAKETKLLLDCPFCGGQPIQTSEADFNPMTGKVSFIFYVTCRDCRARSGKLKIKNRAISLWNRRGV